MAKAGNINNVFYRDLNKKYPVIERAEGLYLYDNAGSRYLDFGSGIGVVNIGYNVPDTNQSMTAQASKTSFVYSAPFTTEAQIALSRKIIGMSPEGMSKVLLVSGGSVAIESAIKLARQAPVRVQGLHGQPLRAVQLHGRNAEVRGIFRSPVCRSTSGTGRQSL